MADVDKYERWLGRAIKPAKPHRLVAGGLTLDLVGVEARDVMMRGTCVSDRIYFALRDRDWNVVPAEVSEVTTEVTSRGMRTRFRSRHAAPKAAFAWRGEITVADDGYLSYGMWGEALTEFEFNRIGLNVCLPSQLYQGCAYRAWRGAEDWSGALPVEIGAQRIADGHIHALFAPFDRLDLTLPDGELVRLICRGVACEIEDQRNWTDVSFKAYGPSLLDGFPHRAVPGQQFFQEVQLSLVSVGQPRAAGAAPQRRRRPIRITLGKPGSGPLPDMGLTIAPALAPSAAELHRLRALRLGHLRADLDLGAPDWEAQLERCDALAATAGAPLEVAVRVPQQCPALTTLGAAIGRSRSGVRRIIVFRSAGDVRTTPAQLLLDVRGVLESAGIPLIAGTPGFFAELNRLHPPVQGSDGVSWASIPQVHVGDDGGVVENLDGLTQTILNARRICGDLPLIISPLCLIGAGGPFPTTAGPFGLDPSIDLRLAALFGIAWTSASVSRVAAGGVAAVTYYDVVGPRGVMAAAADQRTEGVFGRIGDGVFPVYHLFADMAEVSQATARPATTSAPRVAEAFAVVAGGRSRVHISNLTDATRQVVVGPLARSEVAVRVLDEASFDDATRRPTVFRRAETMIPVTDGLITLDLLPYAYACLREV